MSILIVSCAFEWMNWRRAKWCTHPQDRQLQNAFLTHSSILARHSRQWWMYGILIDRWTTVTRGLSYRIFGCSQIGAILFLHEISHECQADTLNAFNEYVFLAPAMNSIRQNILNPSCVILSFPHVPFSLFVTSFDVVWCRSAMRHLLWLFTVPLLWSE